MAKCSVLPPAASEDSSAVGRASLKIPSPFSACAIQHKCLFSPGAPISHISGSELDGGKRIPGEGLIPARRTADELLEAAVQFQQLKQGTARCKELGLTGGHADATEWSHVQPRTLWNSTNNEAEVEDEGVCTELSSYDSDVSSYSLDTLEEAESIQPKCCSDLDVDCDGVELGFWHDVGAATFGQQSVCAQGPGEWCSETLLPWDL